MSADTDPQTFRVIVASRTPSNDRSRLATIYQLGYTKVKAVRTSRLYFFTGRLTTDDATTIAQTLLTDPVTEQFEIESLPSERTTNPLQIQSSYLPGVTDPAANNLIRAAAMLGITIEQAATGAQFVLDGDLVADEVEAIATQALVNTVVQQVAIGRPIDPPFVAPAPEDGTVEIVALTEATDAELDAISRERRLALNSAEMQAIRTYYRNERREPTDIELEMLAQTWSEHCVHKTFKATIDYTDADGNRETIDGLLNTYIRGATEKINKPWVYSAFVDNAGIIRFDDQFDLAFKVETHNHPSALEPFGGANTGIGGVIRDVLGVSARPIANTDILCFGPPDLPANRVPAGVLHPRRIADGVIHGIEDYGNKMGIPTVNGAIVYHEGYTSNPLVYCGCVGILPHGSHRSSAEAGDLIVALGGRVGRDGLRGATFSSMEMDQETSEIAGTAVQIGHPIKEKQVLEVVLRCRDEQLYTAITDCGAGGFSSAVGEMGEHLGARVQLKNALLKYPGLRPWEIWLSEAQERMVLAVPPHQWERVQAIAASQNVDALCLGTFENTGQMQIFYGDRLVGDLAMPFLHDGLPQRHMQAEWQTPTPTAQPVNDLMPTQEALLALLAHPTIRSKEDVVRRYDHEVQSGTAVKPFVGVANHGPSDATVIVPQDTILNYESGSMKDEMVRGFALSNGICPTYGALDPYAMAWAAVDEALRNIVAVGANPDEVAILDNFCWGNPNLPDRLGALVRCSQGCHDAAVAYRTPFISGKDSLNNEYVGADGNQYAIPGTILISAVGIVPDVGKTVTMDFKAVGNDLYVIGQTRAEMGGSLYALMHGETGGIVPQPLMEGLMRYRSLYRAIRDGLIESCHDLSEGGLGVALAEMAIAGGIGAEINLKDLPANVAHDDVLLFSESIGRFLIEVAPENEQALRFALAADPLEKVGTTGNSQQVTVNGYNGETIVAVGIGELETAWRGHVNERSAISNQQSATDHQPLVSSHQRVATSHQLKKRVLILHANGTNRDRDAALACELAGGDPEIVHLNRLAAGERDLLDYHLLVVPGGFSYGDDLGAGVLFSAELQHRFGEQLHQFVADGRPTLGICNGFQVLVKAGIFDIHNNGQRSITLTYNEQGRFECRWVTLQPNPASPCIFTRDLTNPIYCPVAHGEGRFLSADSATTQFLQDNNLIALTYTNPDQSPLILSSSKGPVIPYPANPNGSLLNIAGITNRAGNVLGLMPHPENHIFAWQHPQRHRGASGLDGLRLLINGIKAA